MRVCPVKTGLNNLRTPQFTFISGILLYFISLNIEGYASSFLDLSKAWGIFNNPLIVILPLSVIGAIVGRMNK